LDKPVIGGAARLTLSLLRRWDRESASRANHLLAISHWTAQKIKHAWGREARVIYPPVEVDRFSPAKERDDFYLHVSRLVPYKMTAEIICAFNQLKLPLIIVGDGPEMPHLKKNARGNVKLLGYQPDEVIADLMNRAKGFVYMAVEDFGIAMAEAQAAGCPVIAYGKGGATEIVQDGETGLLFQEQTSLSLIEAILHLKNKKIYGKAAQENAARFSSNRFREEFSAYMKPITRP
jgi:glycosyltransferase involved in cell wall biosynthesis